MSDQKSRSTEMGLKCKSSETSGQKDFSEKKGESKPTIN